MTNVRTGYGSGGEEKPKQYVIISDAEQERIQKKLDDHVASGYKPIMMSSCASPRGVEITLVLEKR
jgi:hypothetical protein